ncbi:MAG TPA: hemerythrin domain-containing protein [Pseudomonadales bacterium]
MHFTGLPPVLIERLGADHARIAGVVRELESLADTLDDEPDWEQIAALLEFLDYFADRIHHPLEDRIFDLVVNKGLTPTERHLVFRNLGQHQEIKALTESLAREVRVARSGGAVDCGDFRGALAAYVALQRRHMRFEESHLFPLLEGALDRTDWNALCGILEQAPFAQTHEETR